MVYQPDLELDLQKHTYSGLFDFYISEDAVYSFII